MTKRAYINGPFNALLVLCNYILELGDMGTVRNRDIRDDSESQ